MGVRINYSSYRIVIISPDNGDRGLIARGNLGGDPRYNVIY